MSAAVTLVVVAVVVVVLVDGADGFASRSANERARLGVDLLVTVGANVPDLTRSRVQRGLSAADGAELDAAVIRGQRQGVLSDLTIWDRSGRVVYSANARVEGTRPSLSRELRAALRGVSLTRRQRSELDLTSHRRSGVLDALVPLRDDRGRVYGAVETSLPLRPIVAESAHIRSRILVFVIGSAILLWLLLLPITTRGARGIAQSWAPGRRRTLKAFRHALADREVELVYQPQIDPRDGAVHAVEALVRCAATASYVRRTAFWWPSRAAR